MEFSTILACILYIFISVPSCKARPSFYHRVGYTFYENAFSGNGTMQAHRGSNGSNGQDCQDKNPLCVHMATAENCRSMDLVIRDCPRSCGKCKVECESVEPMKREICDGVTTEIPCHQALCCWDGTEPSEEEGDRIKCYKPYFHPSRATNDQRSVIHM